MLFNNKEVRESTLKTMMDEAIDAEDWTLVKQLRDIEKETDINAFEARMNGLLLGYGAAITGVIIGGVVVKVVISRQRRIV